jgi:putative endonuclease
LYRSKIRIQHFNLSEQMATHNELGKRGEQIAQQYLQNKGYRILDRNWRFDRKEIDIIAMKDEQLVFVEVKTRSTGYFGKPAESVTDEKQKYLIDAAEEYILSNDYNYESRFDVISVVLKKGVEPEIEHFEWAFTP